MQLCAGRPAASILVAELLCSWAILVRQVTCLLLQLRPQPPGADQGRPAEQTSLRKQQQVLMSAHALRSMRTHGNQVCYLSHPGTPAEWL